MTSEEARERIAALRNSIESLLAFPAWMPTENARQSLQRDISEWERTAEILEAIEELREEIRGSR